jgi:murein L,D-transpeptidase YcbB/YkuD
MPGRTRSTALFAALFALVATGYSRAAAELTIRVNVPAFRMDVMKDGEVIRTYSVGVGSSEFPTPLGAWTLKYIEWNPWWIPPDSPWARGEKRTPPGPRNPMGRAKIGFLPLYYMHGNPGGIGAASSHGCVRMNNEDVQELARLVAEETGADIGSDEIRALERNSKQTKRVTLPPTARIEIVYRLTEEIDGETKSYKDIYGMGLTFRDHEMRAKGGAGAMTASGAR